MPKRSATSSNRSDGHVRANRRSWDRDSDAYDARHRKILGGAKGPAWGLWRVPESTLQLLGRVRGKSILELGCGAARWSIWLARRNARPVGLDVSRAQLTKAAALAKSGKVRLPLLQASAEHVPLRSASFDIIFCDWGAMTFADPSRTVPECARLLRPGGRLVFATASPFRYVSFDYRKDRQARRLTRSYFDLDRV
ncbi:MAG TPA: class I SAM-dependent methyltransferase, partial [Thermoplasmata archaeon]|nr:class I SAM-dependent methyltransferase [Thermoplasmata archaeon]